MRVSGTPTVVPGRKNGGAQLVYPPHGDPRRGSRSGRDVRVRGLFICGRLGRPVGCGLDCRIGRSDRSRIHRRHPPSTAASASSARKRIGGSLRRRVHRSLGRSVRWRVGSEHGQPRRGREGRRQPHDDRPAARLVQLRQGHRRLLAEVRDQDQRAQSRWRLEGRARGDHREQGQQGPGRSGRRRRRARVRPAGRLAGPLPAVQGLDLGQHPRLGQVRRRHVVRRLLRRDVVRGQHRGRQDDAQGLGRPTQARLQEHGLAVR